MMVTLKNKSKASPCRKSKDLERKESQKELFSTSKGDLKTENSQNDVYALITEVQAVNNPTDVAIIGNTQRLMTLTGRSVDQYEKETSKGSSVDLLREQHRIFNHNENDLKTLLNIEEKSSKFELIGLSGQREVLKQLQSLNLRGTSRK